MERILDNSHYKKALLLTLRCILPRNQIMVSSMIQDLLLNRSTYDTFVQTVNVIASVKHFKAERLWNFDEWKMDVANNPIVLDWIVELVRPTVEVGELQEEIEATLPEVTANAELKRCLTSVSITTTATAVKCLGQCPREEEPMNIF